MPRSKPSWTKRKKGGHRSAAKVQDIQAGDEVTAEVPDDLVCQSTAVDLGGQSTECDGMVTPSTASLPKDVHPVGEFFHII